MKTKNIRKKAKSFVQILGDRINKDGLSDKRTKKLFKKAIANIPDDKLKSLIENDFDTFFSILLERKNSGVETEVVQGVEEVSQTNEKKRKKSADDGSVVPAKKGKKIVEPEREISVAYNLYGHHFKKQVKRMKKSEEIAQDARRCFLGETVSSLNEVDMKGILCKINESAEGHLSWVQEAIASCEILIGNKSSAALKRVMLHLNSVLVEQADLFGELDQNEREEVKAAIQRMMRYFHIKFTESEGSFDKPSYWDLMAALLSVYLDLEALIAKSSESEPSHRLPHKLLSFTVLLLQPETYFLYDVILQQSDIEEESLPLFMPIFRYALLTPRNVNKSNSYTKYICAYKRVVEWPLGKPQRKEFRKAALSVVAPPSYFSWATSIDAEIFDDTPLTTKSSGIQITQFMVQEATAELMEELLNLFTSDCYENEKYESLESSQLTSSSDIEQDKQLTESEGNLFFIDTKASSNVKDVPNPDNDEAGEMEVYDFTEADIEKELADMDKSESEHSDEASEDSESEEENVKKPTKKEKGKSLKTNVEESESESDSEQPIESNILAEKASGEERDDVEIIVVETGKRDGVSNGETATEGAEVESEEEEDVEIVGEAEAETDEKVEEVEAESAEEEEPQIEELYLEGESDEEEDAEVVEIKEVKGDAKVKPGQAEDEDVQIVEEQEAEVEEIDVEDEAEEKDDAEEEASKASEEDEMEAGGETEGKEGEEKMDEGSEGEEGEGSEEEEEIPGESLQDDVDEEREDEVMLNDKPLRLITDFIHGSKDDEEEDESEEDDDSFINDEEEENDEEVGSESEVEEKEIGDENDGVNLVEEGEVIARRSKNNTPKRNVIESSDDEGSGEAEESRVIETRKWTNIKGKATTPPVLRTRSHNEGKDVVIDKKVSSPRALPPSSPTKKTLSPTKKTQELSSPRNQTTLKVSSPSPKKQTVLTSPKMGAKSPLVPASASPRKLDVASPKKTSLLSPVKKDATSPKKETVKSPQNTNGTSWTKLPLPQSAEKNLRKSVSPVSRGAVDTHALTCIRLDVETSPQSKSPSTAISKSPTKMKNSPDVATVKEKILSPRKTRGLLQRDHVNQSPEKTSQPSNLPKPDISNVETAVSRLQENDKRVLSPRKSRTFQLIEEEAPVLRRSRRISTSSVTDEPPTPKKQPAVQTPTSRRKSMAVLPTPEVQPAVQTPTSRRKSMAVLPNKPVQPAVATPSSRRKSMAVLPNKPVQPAVATPTARRKSMAILPTEEVPPAVQTPTSRRKSMALLPNLQASPMGTKTPTRRRSVLPVQNEDISTSSPLINTPSRRRSTRLTGRPDTPKPS